LGFGSISLFQSLKKNDSNSKVNVDIYVQSNLKNVTDYFEQKIEKFISVLQDMLWKELLLNRILFSVFASKRFL